MKPAIYIKLKHIPVKLATWILLLELDVKITDTSYIYDIYKAGISSRNSEEVTQRFCFIWGKYIWKWVTIALSIIYKGKVITGEKNTGCEPDFLF